MPRRAGTASFARQLGARLRALRKEAGITQEALAWDCGLAKSHLSQIEAGKRVPSVPVLFALAKRIGVEAADVVGFRVKQPRLQLLDAARRGDAAGIRGALRKLGIKLDGASTHPTRST